MIRLKQKKSRSISREEDDRTKKQKNIVCDVFAPGVVPSNMPPLQSFEYCGILEPQFLSEYFTVNQMPNCTWNDAWDFSILILNWPLRSSHYLIHQKKSDLPIPMGDEHIHWIFVVQILTYEISMLGI